MEGDKITIDKSVNDYCMTIGLPKNKSKMTIGNTIVFNIKHFNWLQKIMWRILLGIEIEDVED